MPKDVDAALADLRRDVRDMGSALIAYSGGVDSALLMATAHRVLGKKALACIGASPSYPQRELAGAVKIASDLGANVRTVETQEHLNPHYAA